MQDPWEGSRRQTPIRARRRQASPASAGNHPRFSRAQGVTRRDTDDSYVLSHRPIHDLPPSAKTDPVGAPRTRRSAACDAVRGRADLPTRPASREDGGTDTESAGHRPAPRASVTMTSPTPRAQKLAARHVDVDDHADQGIGESCLVTRCGAVLARCAGRMPRTGACGSAGRRAWSRRRAVRPFRCRSMMACSFLPGQVALAWPGRRAAGRRLAAAVCCRGRRPGRHK